MNFYNEDYEKYILGCMLTDNTLIDVISGKLSKACFYSLKNALIFETICEEMDSNKCCTILSLINKLSQMNPADIASLTDAVNTTSNWDFYVEEVKKFYLARQMKTELATKLEKLSPDTILDTVHSLDSDLTNFMKHDTGKPVDVKKMCGLFVQSVIDASKNKDKYLGMDTGWDNLSGILDGLQSGKLVIIGARPSVGKTAFALQLARNFAQQKIKTCIFSLEMTANSLMTRLASLESGMSIYSLQHGMCATTMSGLGKVNSALARIYEFPLKIYDSGLTDEKELISRIRVQAKTEGTKVFFVDHIGLVRHSNPMMKRVEQLDDITQKLLHTAQELDVTIILLCQLRRDAEGKKPCLADLRDSGAIEQNADICMFIHRERATGNETEIASEIMVVKHRDGACGTAKMLFLPKNTKFVECKDDYNEKTA